MPAGVLGNTAQESWCVLPWRPTSIIPVRNLFIAAMVLSGAALAANHWFLVLYTVRETGNYIRGPLYPVFFFGMGFVLDLVGTALIVEYQQPRLLATLHQILS